MIAQWVQDEMATVELNDKRLNKRLRQVVSDLGARCTASIPAACGGYAEMTAAYRLFDNDKVTYEKVLAPHVERTRQRIAEQPVALLGPRHLGNRSDAAPPTGCGRRAVGWLGATRRVPALAGSVHARWDAFGGGGVAPVGARRT